MSLYQYVSSAPTNRVDPSGLYGPDVHFTSTFVMALQEGFNLGSAYKLAMANNGQDDPDRAADTLRINNPMPGRDWTLAQSVLGNALFWDSAANELWHLSRTEGWDGRVRPESPQSEVLIRAAINGQATLQMPGYISHRLLTGSMNTDIMAKTSGNTAYNLQISHGFFGGRTISVTNVGEPLDTFGQGLHAYQDSFAHQGGLTGHPHDRKMPGGGISYIWNSVADDIRQDPVSYGRAVAGTRAWMRQFLAAHPEYGKPWWCALLGR